jgi:hypothetical protein
VWVRQRDKRRDKWHEPGVSRISPHPRLRYPVHTSRTAICAARRISPLGSHTHSVCVRLGERRQGIRPGRRLQKYEQAAGWTWGQPQRHLRRRHRRQRHRARRPLRSHRRFIHVHPYKKPRTKQIHYGKLRALKRPRWPGP